MIRDLELGVRDGVHQHLLFLFIKVTLRGGETAIHEQEKEKEKKNTKRENEADGGILEKITTFPIKNSIQRF